MTAPSTSAYADVPPGGTGPGVLVLHSWWGLTGAIRHRCNQLADAGYTALAPDLFGEVATDAAHGEQLLTDADADLLAIGVRSCADALRHMPATPDEAIMVVGFSMGTSLGLWLSEREPDLVAAVVGFYGTQGIDFTETSADYQFHMAVDDPMIDPDELALMEASLQLARRPVEVHTYDDVGHWFAEPGTSGYDEVAADESWRRTLAFLDQHR